MSVTRIPELEVSSKLQYQIAKFPLIQLQKKDNLKGVGNQ
jgi:hypothetical protein